MTCIVMKNKRLNISNIKFSLMNNPNDSQTQQSVAQ